MEDAKVKKKFELMTSLMGISKTQYLAILEFEKFYLNKQNDGIKSLQKRENIETAKQLFACWDIQRYGHIDRSVLTKNLISFGVSLDENSVNQLISLI